jgi:hypothetical protein
MWCIPKVDGEYVARMEDVLDLYAEAPDPNQPVVCDRLAGAGRCAELVSEWVSVALALHFNLVHKKRY